MTAIFAIGLLVLCIVGSFLGRGTNMRVVGSKLWNKLYAGIVSALRVTDTASGKLILVNSPLNKLNIRILRKI